MLYQQRQNRAGVPPSPVFSSEADQSPNGKHGCKETRPADWSAMRAPRRTCRSVVKLVVSLERTSPRGYAFFVPLGGGERPFGVTPTFTGQGYYSKNRRVCTRRHGVSRIPNDAPVAASPRPPHHLKFVFPAEQPPNRRLAENCPLTPAATGAPKTALGTTCPSSDVKGPCDARTCAASSRTQP